MKRSEKTKRLCKEYGLRVPIVMAPMARACPPALAAAVGYASGMGACGVLMLEPHQILE